MHIEKIEIYKFEKAGTKMLRVYFGPKENAIYNTSANFRNNYDKKWLLDDFARTVIKDVDNSEVLDSYAIKSPVLEEVTKNSRYCKYSKAKLEEFYMQESNVVKVLELLKMIKFKDES